MTNTELQVKHTPAPWLLEDTTVYALEHDGWNKGVEEFRNRFSVFVSSAARNVSKEELIANTRLIAAAPDLLEALKAAIKTAEFEGYPYRGWYSKARATIVKAEGKA